MAKLLGWSVVGLNILLGHVRDSESSQYVSLDYQQPAFKSCLARTSWLGSMSLAKQQPVSESCQTTGSKQVLISNSLSASLA